MIIKQGDTLPTLSARLQQNGSRIDLDGCTVRVRLLRQGAVFIDAECTIVDASTGAVEYAWQDGDTSATGTLQGEFIVTYEGGKRLTVPTEGALEIIIKPSLAP